jgi:hypothetical protein
LNLIQQPVLTRHKRRLRPVGVLLDSREFLVYWKRLSGFPFYRHYPKKPLRIELTCPSPLKDPFRSGPLCPGCPCEENGIFLPINARKWSGSQGLWGTLGRKPQGATVLGIYSWKGFAGSLLKNGFPLNPHPGKSPDKRRGG